MLDGTTGLCDLTTPLPLPNAGWAANRQMHERLTNEGPEMNNWSSNEKGTPDEKAN